MTIRTTKAVFLAFKNNDPYRIYYTVGSKTILSAEWLYDIQEYDGEEANAQEYDIQEQTEAEEAIRR